MTTSPATRHLVMIAVVLAEAILIIGLTRGYDNWSGFAFGFAIAMAVMAPIMFFVELRRYRRQVQE